MLQTGPIIFRFRGVFGVPVEVGQTLIFLVVLFGGLTLFSGGEPLWVAGMVVIFLTVIYLHELGHAWACLIQGVPVRRIVLHGGGGFCEQERGATDHEQEFIVAMGPLVNLAFWAAGSLALGGVWRLGMGAGYFGAFLALFAVLNLWFFFFNMLPVQPLDGGRILLLGLRRFLPRKKAARIAGGVGLVVAVLWWPVLIYVWSTTGWLMLFLPSFRRHHRMMMGELKP
ncbi:site-2 protease family protein [Aquicoccus sp. G2-2]|uniref:site-2 protease family protein n=1 Tax=Aquicoccus sp. G2-2 TaxID=3092120 RepID=UPI002ADF2D43|nr:site-2 protease family protein [Aquicoccus sp. G2-2]MEA1113973.1 site-2 protease family protein [Aquicoccus sp. G2-2]